VTALPFTYDPRPDTGTTSIRLGMWLFLGSEAMLFASVFAAFILLRTNAAAWPDGHAMVTPWSAALLTILLLAATRSVRTNAVLTACLGGVFLVVKFVDYLRLWSDDVRPARNLMVASWYLMTGLHWLHVAGGVAAALWVAAQARHVAPPHHAERVRALMLYWLFVDLVWGGIIACFAVS
jgi:heme/copper-type cytochrome/quinol oxidase subunit 3